MLRTNGPQGSDSTTQQKDRTIEDLAMEQGVKPAGDFESLLGDFWPEDESADDLISAVRQWRREGADRGGRRPVRPAAGHQ